LALNGWLFGFKGEIMLCYIIFISLFLLSSSALAVDDPKEITRPITEADSVVAVYWDDWGHFASKGPTIILLAWPDGHIIWSGDRLKGGAPYFTGDIDPKKVATLLARFDKDGLFADEKLSHLDRAIHSQFITVFIKSGKKKVEMQSWHELMEGTYDVVADQRGVTSDLEGRRRLDVLRKAPADYLFYRFVWTETRAKVTDLIPLERIASAGKPFMRAGVLSWKEPAAKVK
jgi:hypothetical protein